MEKGMDDDKPDVIQYLLIIGGGIIVTMMVLGLLTNMGSMDEEPGDEENNPSIIEGITEDSKTMADLVETVLLLGVISMVVIIIIKMVSPILSGNEDYSTDDGTLEKSNKTKYKQNKNQKKKITFFGYKIK